MKNKSFILCLLLPITLFLFGFTRVHYIQYIERAYRVSYLFTIVYYMLFGATLALYQQLYTKLSAKNQRTVTIAHIFVFACVYFCMRFGIQTLFIIWSFENVLIWFGVTLYLAISSKFIHLKKSEAFDDK